MVGLGLVDKTAFWEPLTGVDVAVRVVSTGLSGLATFAVRVAAKVPATAGVNSIPMLQLCPEERVIGPPPASQESLVIE